MSLSPAEQQFRTTIRYVAVLTTVLVMASLVFASFLQHQSSKASDLRELVEAYHLRTVPLLDRIANQLAALELQTGQSNPRAKGSSGRAIESPRVISSDVQTTVQTVAEIQRSVGLEHFASAVSRLEDRFARMERSVLDRLEERKPISAVGLPLRSVRLANDQLRLLHEIGLKQALAASHARRASAFQNTAPIAGGLAAICALILARIAFLLRRDLRRAKRVEAELDRSRARLLHSQKIEALGRLTGGVAHDFNNLLTSILGHAELLREGLTPGDPLCNDAKQIMEGAERASALTRQLLAFSRQQIGKPETVDVNALISQLLRMLDDLLGEKVSLTAALDPELGSVRLDPRQLEQVIVNLIVNARDSMPSGGIIRLETANVDIGPGSPPLASEVEEGRYSRIRVIDEGCGIDFDILLSIFDPFFTTKPEGEGTGLGLSTVKGLVTSWGGDVFVRSEPGRGSSFDILLPRHEATPKVQNLPAEQPRLARGSETILVVEDQGAVRKLACDFLIRAGYTVLEAADGAEALRLCSAVGRRVDLMLVDVVMPGLSGPELVERLERCQPEVRVLYMSGYTDDEIFRQRVRRERDALVEKPFRRATLLEAVRSTLDAESMSPDTLGA